MPFGGRSQPRSVFFHFFFRCSNHRQKQWVIVLPKRSAAAESCPEYPPHRWYCFWLVVVLFWLKGGRLKLMPCPSLLFCCPICRFKRQEKVAVRARARAPDANGGSNGLAAATIDLPCAGHHCLPGGREHHAVMIPFTRRPIASRPHCASPRPCGPCAAGRLPAGNETSNQDGHHIVGRWHTPPSTPLQFSQPTNPPILLFV